ncbi:MAG: hypothetical protein JWR44_3832 [Hymenobacter sp.]|jgi:hypothetical protein|nr:hypothetical protein [Hymenobacter sp.]
MENVINTLYIQNFKSIRSAVLHPRRVNLIIGQPNVGKSTVLEAISLLGSFAYEQKKKFMRSFIRYEKPAHLFHDGLMSNLVRIETDRDVCLLGRSPQGKGFQYGAMSQAAYRLLRVQMGLPLLDGRSKNRPADDALLLNGLHAYLTSTGPLPEPGYIYTEFDRQGVVDQPAGGKFLTTAPPWYPRPVKSYRFKRAVHLNRRYPDAALRPPHGNNLVQVLENFADLRHEFATLFEEHGLRMRVRPDAGRFEVMKEMDGLSISYPYTGCGDTLQRYGFYLAAMASNNKATLLLEEPESHSYPAYVTMLAERIATQQNNQFFVTTHSPAFFNEVLENMVPYDSRVPELAVFVVHYKDFHTKIRQLSDEEVRGLRRDSLEVFQNMGQLAQEPPVARKV